jgi:hypothetical protein
MLAIERHRRILEEARKEGTVRTQELAAILGVAEEFGWIGSAGTVEADAWRGGGRFDDFE